MASAVKKNIHGMLPRDSFRSLPRSPRYKMMTQITRPTVSRTCQNLPRSMYSKPCIPKVCSVPDSSP